MERALSVEEKIRRAEEIYERRQGENLRKTATVSINDSNKKDIKLLKKMLIQIAVSLCIYFIVYIIQNSGYIFSEGFINQAKKILSYDMNFSEIYTVLKEKTEHGIESLKNKKLGIGGAEETDGETLNTNSSENVQNDEINSNIESTTNENANEMENTKQENQESDQNTSR